MIRSTRAATAGSCRCSCGAAGEGSLRPATVVAIALNTRGLDDEGARAAIAAAEDETGLPADDPVRFGAGKIVDAVVGKG